MPAYCSLLEPRPGNNASIASIPATSALSVGEVSRVRVVAASATAVPVQPGVSQAPFTLQGMKSMRAFGSLLLIAHPFPARLSSPQNPVATLWSRLPRVVPRALYSLEILFLCAFNVTIL